MSGKYLKVWFIIILFLVVGCTALSDNPLYGKWVLSSRIVGMSPKSYWFKRSGQVVASWQESNKALQSKGRFEFIDKGHIKIVMHDGHYKGITFFFQIVKIDKQELVLRGSIQDIKMRRAE